VGNLNDRLISQLPFTNVTRFSMIIQVSMPDSYNYWCFFAKYTRMVPGTNG